MLVLKTNIYQSKLIVIQHFSSLVREHSIPDSDFMDRHVLDVDSAEKESFNSIDQKWLEKIVEFVFVKIE